jgi:hypothetical protein
MNWRAGAAAAGVVLATVGAAHAETCTVLIGNGTSDILISVTVRAEFAPPGSESDRNLPVTLPGKLTKGQTARVNWTCASNNVSYVATGMFANAIKRQSAPFTPKASFTGAVDTAWIE